MIRAVSIMAGPHVLLLACGAEAMADEKGLAATQTPRAGIDKAVHAHFTKCGTPVTFDPNSITVRLQLNRDGSVAGGPSVAGAKPSTPPDAAVQAALRAVRQCAPIALPPSSYDHWRDVQIKFETRAPDRPFGASVSPL